VAIKAYGWVESRFPTFPWDGVLNISYLTDWCYPAFRAIFGYELGDNLVPISPMRGIPDDASIELKKEIDNQTRARASWVLWQEIQRFD